MFSKKLLAVAGLLAISVKAQSSCSTTQQQYVDIAGFPRSDGCVPSGFTTTFDLGQSSADDASTRCRSQCVSRGSDCAGFVAQLNKAGDSNFWSGICYFYRSAQLPSQPRSCADKPSLLLGQVKDDTLNCIVGAKASAIAFCSSFLSIGVQTRYTTTITPTSTTTKPVQTTVRTTTTVRVSTATSTTITVTTTAIDTTTATSYTTLPADSIADSKVRRAVAVAAPACLSSRTPVSRLSAACQCLSIASSTTLLASTAPAKVVTVTSTSTSLSTSRSTTLITTTTFTKSTTSTTRTITTTSTTSTCPASGCCTTDSCLAGLQRFTAEASAFCQLFTAKSVTVTTTPTVSLSTVTTLSTTPTVFDTATEISTVTPTTSATALSTSTVTAVETSTTTSTLTYRYTYPVSFTTTFVDTTTVPRGITYTYTTTYITVQPPPVAIAKRSAALAIPNFVSTCGTSQLSSACTCFGAPKSTVTITETGTAVTVIASTIISIQTGSATTVTSTTSTTTSASTVTTLVDTATVSETASTSTSLSLVTKTSTTTLPRIISRTSFVTTGDYTSTSTVVQVLPFPSRCPEADGLDYVDSTGVRWLRKCGFGIANGTAVNYIAGFQNLNSCIEYCVRQNRVYPNLAMHCDTVAWTYSPYQCILFKGGDVVLNGDQSLAALVRA